MSFQNVLRQIQYALSRETSTSLFKLEDSATLDFGTGAGIGTGNQGDVRMRWDGTDFDILALADDAIFKIGNGTNSFDLWLYGNASTTYVSWDASADSMKFEDSCFLGFGSNTAGPGSKGDINITWDGTRLLVAQTTVDSEIHWGVSGAGINHTFFGDTLTADCTWDQTNDQLLFNDNAKLAIGTGGGTVGDVQIYWDATKLVAKSLAVSPYVNAIPTRMDPNYATSVYEIFDDFFEFDPTATVGNWVVVEDDAADTQTLVDDVPGGVLKLTQKATTDNDSSQISYVSAPFLLAAGKHLWFECRIRGAAGATAIDIIAGLVALGEDLTGVADNRPANGIVFFKTEAQLSLGFGASKGGTDTGTNTDVGADWTTGWHTLGFYVNGVTSATPYYDGVAGTAITATFPDVESVAPFFLCRNGDGTTTQTLEVDYVRCVQLR